jgi:hypothetical protein
MRTRVVAALCFVPFLAGCPNPNTYGTPRTTPKGEMSHTVAVEGVYIGGETKKTNVSGSGATATTTTTTESVGVGLPTLPTYQLRYGVSDEVDFGVAVRNLSSLGADVKWNFVRGSVDLAIAPGVQWFGVFTGKESVQIFYIHAPLLVGLNLSDSFSFVLSPGFVYAAAIGNFTSSGTGADRNAVITSGGALARFGLGLNIRPSKKFHIQPEVTGMRAFNDAEGLFLMFGLGFNFGHLPQYDDLDDEPKSSAPPAAAPAAPAPVPIAPTPAPQGT